MEPLEDRRLLDAGRLFVDAAALGAATGDSWTDAYTDLQSALAVAKTLNTDSNADNDVADIWIAKGTYRPTELLEVGDARTATFSLVAGVSLVGGFAGGESSVDERVVVDGQLLNETILSGDLGVVDDASDNAYTVVYVDLASGKRATLNGVAISGGNANGSSSSSALYRTSGAGVFFTGSGTLTITNSTLSGNSASYGGGIYNHYSTLTVTNSTLSGNSAQHFGGGICNDYGTMNVTNSTVSGNSASSGSGGGIRNLYGTLDLTNSTITGNSANNYGGGIDSYNSILDVTNSTISGNSASNCDGGGICNAHGTLDVTNSTITGNSARNGGGIYSTGSTGTASLGNTIVAANTATHAGLDIYRDSGTISGSYNLIGDGSGQSSLVHGVNGNLVGTQQTPLDPLFVHPPSGGDFGDLRLLLGSPAINAGSNNLAVDSEGNPLTTDLAGQLRIQGARVDMGAYEYRELSHRPMGDTHGGISMLTFYFPDGMDIASFDIADDVVRFEGPEEPLSVTGYSWIDTKTLELTFATQTTVGVYALVIEPNILDADGRPLDVNGNGIPGESPDDQYTATFAITAPRITGHTPSGTVPPPVDAVRLSFDRTMETTSFSLADDIVSFTGPQGTVTPTGFAWLDGGKTLEITFTKQWKSGSYSLVIAPSVCDAYGNLLDQDRDGIAGEPIDDRYTATWVSAYTGTLMADAAWGPEHGVIVVDGTLTVGSGVTLTIKPGTIIKFTSGSQISVNGRLEVRGTAAQPVVFTSIHDDSVGGDTNGDGNATDPRRGNWSGIYASAAGAHLDIDHAVIRYANYGVETLASNTSWRVSNSVISDNNIGLAAHHQQNLAAEAVNCLIVNNWQTGVYFHEYFAGILRNCTIVGNGFAGGWAAAGVHQVGVLIMDNCIVAFNHNGFDSNAQPDLDIRNSLFYNPGGNELYFTSGFTSDVLSRDGNIVADPRFINRETGNYELAAGSPAIDAGRGTLAPATDILGRPRYDDQG
ncbi:MAG: hypothetical protein GX621_14120, partial [Pirellulaceae bacterium]|nr:hypothetical protein [Pirellulaceae bacterium]